MVSRCLALLTFAWCGSGDQCPDLFCSVPNAAFTRTLVFLYLVTRSKCDGHDLSVSGHCPLYVMSKLYLYLTVHRSAAWMARDPVVMDADKVSVSPDEEPWVDPARLLKLAFALLHFRTCLG